MHEPIVEGGETYYCICLKCQNELLQDLPLIGSLVKPISIYRRDKSGIISTVKEPEKDNVYIVLSINTSNTVFKNSRVFGPLSWSSSETPTAKIKTYYTLKLRKLKVDETRV